jgi:putative transposase
VGRRGCTRFTHTTPRSTSNRPASSSTTCTWGRVIPPQDAVSAGVGKIKANTRREIRQRVPELKKVYWRHEFWSAGFFASTVGIDEAVITRYVAFQEKVDKGQRKLQVDFGF